MSVTVSTVKYSSPAPSVSSLCPQLPHVICHYNCKAMNKYSSFCLRMPSLYLNYSSHKIFGSSSTSESMKYDGAGTHLESMSTFFLGGYILLWGQDSQVHSLVEVWHLRKWLWAKLKRRRSLYSSTFIWVSTGVNTGPGVLNPFDLSFYFSSVQFSRSVVSDSLWPHGLQHARFPCLSPTKAAYSNSFPSSQWCHPTISSSVVPFSSCLQSFPVSVFSSESVLHCRWPKVLEF